MKLFISVTSVVCVSPVIVFKRVILIMSSREGMPVNGNRYLNRWAIIVCFLTLHDGETSGNPLSIPNNGARRNFDAILAAVTLNDQNPISSN